MRAAVVVGCLYALGVLAPSVAIAASDNRILIHCFSEIHASAGSAHVHHADGPAHDRDQGSVPVSKQQDSAPENCCGLFGTTAVLTPAFGAFTHPEHAAAIAFVPDNALTDRGNDRIDRPPRYPLSF